MNPNPNMQSATAQNQFSIMVIMMKMKTLTPDVRLEIFQKKIRGKLYKDICHIAEAISVQQRPAKASSLLDEEDCVVFVSNQVEFLLQAKERAIGDVNAKI